MQKLRRKIVPNSICYCSDCPSFLGDKYRAVCIHKSRGSNAKVLERTREKPTDEFKHWYIPEDCPLDDDDNA